MSDDVKADEVSAPFIISWHPGMTEWTSSPFYTPKNDELRWLEVLLEPLLPMSFPPEEAPCAVLFGQAEYIILEAWLTCRVEWIEEANGWHLDRERKKQVIEYCLVAASLHLNPYYVGSRGYWPHPKIGLR